MKTINLAIGLFLIMNSMSVSFAATPERFLILHNSAAETLRVPIKSEITSDSETLDLEAEFRKARLQEVSRPIDISNMVKPEREVKDVDLNLHQVYKNMK